MAPRVSIGTPEWRPIDKSSSTTAWADRERSVDVAITLADHRWLGRAAGGELRRRVFGAKDGGKLLDLDLHQIGGILREIRIRGEDDRHRLADIAHAILRQHGLTIGLQSLDAREADIDRRKIGDVFGGPHRAHAGHRARLRGIDGNDPPVRVGGTDHAHVQLPRKSHVRRKAAAPGHQRPILEARNRTADERHQRDRVSAA